MSDHQPSPEPTEAPEPAAGQGWTRCLPAGSVIFDEGDEGSALYLVRSGAVEIRRRGPAGVHCVARLGPGDLFGEQGTLVEGPRRSRAIVTRDAELLELETSLFEQMCRERADIGLRVSRALAARAEALEQRLTRLEGEDGVPAITRVLLRLARPAAEGACVETTLRILAGESGLSLLDAHRGLQRLMELRLVRLAEDVLIVPDLDALSASLESPEPATR